MSRVRTQWLTLAACALSSVLPIVLTQGWAFWMALTLPLLGWFVARRPDSLWPLGWIAVAVFTWFAGGTGGLWGAAGYAVPLAVVHFVSVMGSRGSPRAVGWLSSDGWRLAGYLAAVVIGMGVVGAVTLLPTLEGLIWVIAAVLMIGTVAALVRFSIKDR